MRGHKPINPLLVSQEGKPGCEHLFILDFTFLFITCISSSVARFLKKQGSLFTGEGSLFFSELKKKVFFFYFLRLRPRPYNFAPANNSLYPKVPESLTWAPGPRWQK